MTVCVLCRKSAGEEQYFIVQRPEKGKYTVGKGRGENNSLCTV